MWKQAILWSSRQLISLFFFFFIWRYPMSKVKVPVSLSWAYILGACYVHGRAIRSNNPCHSISSWGRVGFRGFGSARFWRVERGGLPLLGDWGCVHSLETDRCLRPDCNVFGVHFLYVPSLVCSMLKFQCLECLERTIVVVEWALLWTNFCRLSLRTLPNPESRVAFTLLIVHPRRPMMHDAPGSVAFCVGVTLFVCYITPSLITQSLSLLCFLSHLENIIDVPLPLAVSVACSCHFRTPRQGLGEVLQISQASIETISRFRSCASMFERVFLPYRISLTYLGRRYSIPTHKISSVFVKSVVDS
jgi:hypothetical protein